MSKNVKYFKSGVAALAISGAVVAGSVVAAQAGGFALREQSSIGQGASFAGVAAGGSLSSMFWNPATLTQVGGVNTESVISAIVPRTDVKNISGTYAALGDPGDVGLDAVIPSSYSGVQVTNDLFVGLSINSPYGMATKAKNPSASSFHAATSSIKTIDAKANIAYRINDVFSVGAGVGATYAKVRMTSAPYPTLGGASELTGDDWAPTFTLGATVKPFEGTTIGIGYRSETKLNLSGTDYLSVPGVVPSTTRDVTAKLVLPQSVTIGLRQDVSDRFALLAGFEWTDWSSVKDPITINNSVSGVPLHFGYKDSWYASVGGEFAYNDNLTLRGGLGYEKSPIPAAFRNLRLPDADRVWASIGASYNITDKFGVDLGYSHLFIKDDVTVHGENSTGTNSYTATADSSADIISASLRYQWKPEPLFANDDPIVRKY